MLGQEEQPIELTEKGVKEIEEDTIEGQIVQKFIKKMQNRKSLLLFNTSPELQYLQFKQTNAKWRKHFTNERISFPVLHQYLYKLKNNTLYMLVSPFLLLEFQLGRLGQDIKIERYEIKNSLNSIKMISIFGFDIINQKSKNNQKRWIVFVTGVMIQVYSLASGSLIAQKRFQHYYPQDIDFRKDIKFDEFSQCLRLPFMGNEENLMEKLEYYSMVKIDPVRKSIRYRFQSHYREVKKLVYRKALRQWIEVDSQYRVRLFSRKSLKILKKQNFSFLLKEGREYEAAVNRFIRSIAVHKTEPHIYFHYCGRILGVNFASMRHLKLRVAHCDKFSPLFYADAYVSFFIHGNRNLDPILYHDLHFRRLCLNKRHTPFTFAFQKGINYGVAPFAPSFKLISNEDSRFPFMILADSGRVMIFNQNTLKFERILYQERHLVQKVVVDEKKGLVTLVYNCLEPKRSTKKPILDVEEEAEEGNQNEGFFGFDGEGGNIGGYQLPVDREDGLAAALGPVGFRHKAQILFSTWALRTGELIAIGPLKKKEHLEIEERFAFVEYVEDLSMIATIKMEANPEMANVSFSNPKKLLLNFLKRNNILPFESDQAKAFGRKSMQIELWDLGKGSRTPLGVDLKSAGKPSFVYNKTHKNLFILTPEAIIIKDLNSEYSSMIQLKEKKKMFKRIKIDYLNKELLLLSYEADRLIVKVYELGSKMMNLKRDLSFANYGCNGFLFLRLGGPGTQIYANENKFFDLKNDLYLDEIKVNLKQFVTDFGLSGRSGDEGVGPSRSLFPGVGGGVFSGDGGDDDSGISYGSSSSSSEDEEDRFSDDDDDEDDGSSWEGGMELKTGNQLDKKKKESKKPTPIKKQKIIDKFEKKKKKAAVKGVLEENKNDQNIADNPLKQNLSRREKRRKIKELTLAATRRPKYSILEPFSHPYFQQRQNRMVFMSADESIIYSIDKNGLNLWSIIHKSTKSKRIDYAREASQVILKANNFQDMICKIKNRTSTRLFYYKDFNEDNAFNLNIAEGIELTIQKFLSGQLKVEKFVLKVIWYSVLFPGFLRRFEICEFLVDLNLLELVRRFEYFFRNEKHKFKLYMNYRSKEASKVNTLLKKKEMLMNLTYSDLRNGLMRNLGLDGDGDGF